MEFLSDQAKIVHRDIKPENILLTSNNKLKISDFGLATMASCFLQKLEDENKVVSSSTSSARTGPKGLLGTIPYMSPEQFINPDDIDTRSDIYSFGVVLYEMLVGHRPFEGSTFEEIRRAHQQIPPPSIPLNKRRPRCIVDIVMKCLVKNPEFRYSSFSELRNDLSRCWKILNVSGEIPSPIPNENIISKMDFIDWNLRGYAFGKLGELSSSLDCYKRALELKPKKPGAHINVGTALSRLGNVAEALTYFEKDVRLNPKEALCHFALASAYWNRNRQKEAIKEQRTGLHLDPSHIAHWRQLAIMYKEAGNTSGHAEAVDHHQELLRTSDFNSPTGWMNEANYLFLGGDLETALRYYSIAVKLFPEEQICWHDYGVSLARLKKIKEAEKCFDQALKINPNLIFSLIGRGLMRFVRGEIAAAITDFQKCIAIDSDHYLSKLASIVVMAVLIKKETEEVSRVLGLIANKGLIYIL